MLHPSQTRIGGICAIVGTVLLVAGTYLHPTLADPNNAAVAFTEYVVDRMWVASHLMQLAGFALIVAALLFLAQQLEAKTVTGWSRLAAGGAIVSLAVAAALQAVDGIALKTMVHTWAAAPVVRQPVAFQAAFAVRSGGSGVSRNVESFARPHCNDLRDSDVR